MLHNTAGQLNRTKQGSNAIELYVCFSVLSWQCHVRDRCCGHDQPGTAWKSLALPLHAICFKLAGRTLAVVTFCLAVPVCFFTSTHTKLPVFQ